MHVYLHISNKGKSYLALFCVNFFVFGNLHAKNGFNFFPAISASEEAFTNFVSPQIRDWTGGGGSVKLVANISVLDKLVYVDKHRK